MTRAVLKNGTICPIDALPAEWHEGQELRRSTVDEYDGVDLRLRVVAARITSEDFDDLQFGDHRRIIAAPTAFGIANSAFDLKSIHVASDDSGIVLKRRNGDERVVFDAASLRCRIDEEYAAEERTALYRIYTSKDRRLKGTPPPDAWRAEDHSDL